MPRYAVHGAISAIFRLIRFMTLTEDLFRATTREGADNTPVENVLQHKFNACPWTLTFDNEPSKRGSTGSLSSASTPNTHSCTRYNGSPSTKRWSDSSPSANSRDTVPSTKDAIGWNTKAAWNRHRPEASFLRTHRILVLADCGSDRPIHVGAVAPLRQRRDFPRRPSKERFGCRVKNSIDDVGQSSSQTGNREVEKCAQF